MARIRMIKPEFFDDPDIAALTPLARLFFIGLWTQADREGRLVDDMRRLKARLFPYDDAVDLEALIGELEQFDMVRRYQAGEKPGETSASTVRAGEKPGETGASREKTRHYIWIRNFTKHQRPHLKEPPSVIPPYEMKAGKKPGKTSARPVRAGKKPGETSARPLDSGVLSLDSGSLDCVQKQHSLSPQEPATAELPSARAPKNGANTAADWIRTHWVPLYAHYRHQAVYYVSWQRDAPIVARLLKAHDADRLRRLARVFLNSDDEWIEATDRGLGAFASRINWCENRLRQFEAEREER